MPLTSTAIERLLEDAGQRLYGGEAVSQLDHALQTAWFAERNGGDDALVVASLLHDLGHLMTGQGEHDLAEGRDDRHEAVVLPALQGGWPDSVVSAIALHVEAKRYLCRIEPGYLATLSEASRQSLALQGGTMGEEEALAFLDRPHAWRAILLRRHDDAAKVVGLQTPGLAHFMTKVRALATEPAEPHDAT